MPTVISKILARTEEHLPFPKHYLAQGLIAVTLTAYAVRVGYPIIDGLIHKGSGPAASSDTDSARPEADCVNNNLQSVNGKREHGKEQNGDAGAMVKVKNGATKNGKVQNGKVPTKPSSKFSTALTSSIPNLNLDFFRQFYALVRIMIPKWLCTETFLLSGHTICLFLRTFLSIYVANLEGAIVKYTVRKEPHNFVRQLAKWFMVAIPATFINSMIKYFESRIALSFRNRLVEHSYRLYFKNQSYYRVTVLDGRLDNCSQRLTDDIEVVANTVSHLYGQITKPLFDILLMAIALANLTRSRNANIIVGPILTSGVVLVSALILRLVSPKFGQLVAQEAEKKGYLRHVHTRLVTNSEEIAFYGGQNVELNHLRSAYRVLVQHMEHMFGVKLWFVMLEQFLMKYVWSGTGMIVVSLPILLATSMKPSPGQNQQDSISERTHYFTTAKNLLLTGSNAVERLMSSYKDVVELAGHTARVANMFAVLEEVSRGVYHKTVVKNNGTNGDVRQGFRVEFKGDQPIAKGVLVYTTDHTIILDKVPIVTPNCDVVCSSLSLHIRPGQHLLITGPNGCGKSSLFRILSGLWPVYGGELKTPKNAMFYIPQRPYMVIGNLRDQIIYPDTHADMVSKNITEDDLLSIMRMVHLEHLVERDSFHSVKDWMDILSGGEKQRMAIARLFYHKPKYALLDECTSAVSIDVESHIYQSAIDIGITLMTITHRPTLWKFHTHILQFDGAGLWSFSELDATNRLNMKREKEELLRQTETAERNRRLAELNRLLAEDDDSTKSKLKAAENALPTKTKQGNVEIEEID